MDIGGYQLSKLFIREVRNRMTTNKRYVQLLAMAQTGKPLEKDASAEDKKIYEEMKHADEVMRESAKKLGIKNPILEIPLEID